MKGLRVGHFSNAERATGISVFLFDPAAAGAYLICGSSPASYELHSLELETNVTHANALTLLGGSAIGLPAVGGVVRWLQEKNQGWKTEHANVPIVPAAAIYDLAMKQPLPPTTEEAYEACKRASEDNTESGRIGAGTGASVGKIIQTASRMSGGIGRAEIKLPNGVTVIAYVVVNSVGDVRNRSGKIIAGARNDNGEFADCEKYLLAGNAEKRSENANTTLAAIFTDGKFSKIELKRICKMAVAGMARAISPAFTRYDGDMVFAFSLGEKPASEIVVGTVAAEAIQQALEDAVKDSVVIQKG